MEERGMSQKWLSVFKNSLDPPCGIGSTLMSRTVIPNGINSGVCLIVTSDDE